MGRIGLQRLLTVGLAAILFLSFVLSAVGTAGLIRSYLWRSGVRDLHSLMRPVERFLERPKGESRREIFRRRAERLEGYAARGFRRVSQGRGDVYLLKAGEILQGPESEGEQSWVGLFGELSDGIHLLENGGERGRWQVLSRRIDDEQYDQIVIARPWSPSLRILKTLIGYQILTMTLVLGLALLAVRTLARRIVAPLEELRTWSERVGEAKVEKLEQSNITEVGALQNSFYEMAIRVEEALAAHRSFVADASHELKTPLTAISGMLELVGSRPEMSADDRRQALTVAQAEAGRMSTLISDLLVLSRAQARRSGKRENRALAPLVEEQVETLRLLYPKQDFQSSLDELAVWSINSDAFARIVRNLVENAAKYAGGRPIEVGLEQTKQRVVFKVSDRGPGIAPEKLPHVFQRFYRTDDGRTREEGGFGLGLAIVKALVEEVGGELDCQSVLGQGTTFTVCFKKT